MGQADAAAGSTAPPVNLDLRIKLSVMMFLEFAVWGAWWVVLSSYLGALKFEDAWIGRIYGTMSLGAMITPLFFGQIADRYLSSERLMAILHLVGGILLLMLAQVKVPIGFYAMTLVYALIYTPTLTLVNSISFSHLPSAARDFPSIRVLGTIGWIVANIMVGKVLSLLIAKPEETNYPILLASLFSFALGIYSFFLPHTPPRGKVEEEIPFIRALKLLKEPSFQVFYGISFIITIALAFYYSFLSLYLKDKGFTDPATTSTIGQFAEMIVLPFLPWFLTRWGMKWVLALGMLAWAVRYALFSIGEPSWLIVGGVALHGICFDFFFAAGFIHVDNESPPEIRASAQALFGFLTYGAGMWLGSEASGQVVGYFSVSKVHDWSSIWLIPSLGCFVSLFLFLILFRVKSHGAASIKRSESR